eukprot:TRINITY_DN8916_c0_g1_i1.p1 TRINITY_DN8916_c0_g1~~TRINITY_DN8916_c0_g1_i1.p1  ORF type:complete len:454 (-),score=93.93 TRINITY_DN8916_c0_g1_i1:14-1375(-)
MKSLIGSTSMTRSSSSVSFAMASSASNMIGRATEVLNKCKNIGCISIILMLLFYFALKQIREPARIVDAQKNGTWNSLLDEINTKKMEELSYEEQAKREANSVKRKQKVVYFHTTIKGLDPEEARPDLVKTHHCPNNCTLKITSNRHYFEFADAVMFYSRDIDWTMMPPKLPYQFWIFYSEDSPLADKNLRNEVRMAKFEVSVRYRMDSHIIVPFGQDIALPGPLPEIPVELKSDEAPVVWIEDHCHAPNRRERFVHELMHHIRVDSYGKCLKNKEWPEGKTWDDIVKQYKFVLALEHSNCKDYITDKFWKAINFGVVPIVMGAPNIDDYSPSWHSVIKTIDYIDPAQLAEHLHRLNNNDTLYNEYIDFKFDPKFVKPRFDYYLRKFHYTKPWCQLCDFIETAGPSLIKERPRGHTDMTCQNKWGILNQIRKSGVRTADEPPPPPPGDEDEGG